MSGSPSPFFSVDFAPQSHLHVAIAMDGNGRWAEARGLPRTAGHRAGADAVRRVVSAAPSLGIGTLTLFAFSSDNWRRPYREIAGILGLVEAYFRAEVARAVEHGVRVRVLGRRDRLPRTLAQTVEAAERATSAGRTLRLQIALDYSGREAILAAARRLAGHDVTREQLSRELGSGGDVDLLVRPGGEARLSDFLLWECAYAELVFTKVLWPDFDGAALASAVAEFQSRARRFGAAAPVPS